MTRLQIALLVVAAAILVAIVALLEIRQPVTPAQEKFSRDRY